MLEKYFKAKPREVMPNRRMLFTDLVGDPLYKEVKDEGALLKAMEEALEDYNAMSQTPMNLVLFFSAMEHALRIGTLFFTGGILYCLLTLIACRSCYSATVRKRVVGWCWW